MAQCFISFKSRNDCIKFYDTLKAANISGTIINTPRKTQIGCGVSVQFAETDIARVKKLVQIGGAPKTFKGVYMLKDYNHRTIVERLI